MDKVTNTIRYKVNLSPEVQSLSDNLRCCAATTAATSPPAWREYLRHPEQPGENSLQHQRPHHLARSARSQHHPALRHRSSYESHPLPMSSLQYCNPSANPPLLTLPPPTLHLSLPCTSSALFSGNDNVSLALPLVDTQTYLELPHPLFDIPELIAMSQKCNRDRNPEAAKMFYFRLCMDGLDAHPLLGNYIVPMLVESKGIGEAQLAFNRLVQSNEHSWTALIHGYVGSGELQRAFDVFKSMHQYGVEPSVYTFTGLVNGCVELQVLEMGQNVHMEIIIEGHEGDLYLGTILIDMYVKCGSLSDARDIFRELPVHDIVSWNALIAGYAEHGPFMEALHLLEEMQSDGFSANAVTYVCCLKASANAQSIETGRQVHAEVVAKQLECNIYVCTTLIDMYCTCGSLLEAREVFDAFQDRGVTSWNALIVGYIEHGFAHEALECLDRMQAEKVAPTEITYISSLKACGSVEALDKGQRLHIAIVKRGFDSDSLVPSALVDMYAKCGSFTEAMYIFDESSFRDVVLWTALIAGFTEHGHSLEALHCLDQMQLEGVSLDTVAFVCSLNACANLGCIDKGRDIHFKVTGNGLEDCEVNLANTLIDMYAKCGSMADAQYIFLTMPKRDRVSWTTLINGYARYGEVECVFYLFVRMKNEGIKPDDVTFLSILNVCSHNGLLHTAQKYFDEMSTKYNVPPSIGHHNCLVDLLGRAGQLYEALNKLEKMPFEVDPIGWRTVLGACHKWGDVQLGKHAFDFMVKLDENNAAAFIMMSNLLVDESDWE